MSRIPIFFFSLLLPLSGCQPSDDRAPDPRRAWSPHDRPSLLAPDFEYRLSALPTAGTAERMPWPGPYWPTWRDSINHRWAGASVPSPAEKFAQAFARAGVADAVSYFHGVDSVGGEPCSAHGDCDLAGGFACGKRRGEASGTCIESWFGLCHAWAPAAVLEPEPVHPVTYGGVQFAVNDLKALLTVAYSDDLETRAVSLRCDLTGDEADGAPECDDTNAGTFHVVVANLLGRRREAFIEDRIYDYQVWNFPVFAFEVTQLDAIDGAQANQLLGGAQAATYAHNPKAKALRRVRTELSYVGESPAERDGPLTGAAEFTYQDVYDYILELDGAGKIIGGEWVGASRLAHPDFLWRPIKKLPGTVAGGKVAWSNVQELLAAGDAPPQQVLLHHHGAIASGAWQHFPPVALTGSATATLTILSGDADLYVRDGAAPTAASYDCRPYIDGDATEQCPLSGPGEFHVAVFGWAPQTTYELTVARD